MWLPRGTPFEKARALGFERAWSQYLCEHENFDVLVMKCGERHERCNDCGAVPSATTVTCSYE